jgi:hypothetical protein
MHTRQRTIIALTAIVAITSCSGNRAEVEAWLARIDTADATLADANSAWKTAALAFMDSPSPTTGPCEVSDIHGGSDSVSLIERVVVEREGSALREIAELGGKVRTARSLIESEGRRPILPNADLSGAIERAEFSDDWGHDWLLLTSSVSQPMPLPNNTFTPGKAIGWLMVWSYAEGRFVCAGPFEAESDDEVRVQQVGQTGSLRWNLAAAAFEMGQGTLQAIPSD